MGKLPGEEEMVAAASVGDREALELLLSANYDRLARHVKRKLPAFMQSVVDVDDVVQDTFVVAFREVEKSKPQTQMAFVRWLLTVGDSRLFDAIRRHTRQKRGGQMRRVEAAAGDENGSMIELLQAISGKSTTPSGAAAKRWQPNRRL